MPLTPRLRARSAVLAAAAALSLATVALLPSPAHAEGLKAGVGYAPFTNLIIEDPCDPLTTSGLCEPIPLPCLVIPPADLPVTTDAGLTFAPCPEPVALDS